MEETKEKGGGKEGKEKGGEEEEEEEDGNEKGGEMEERKEKGGVAGKEKGGKEGGGDEEEGRMTNDSHSDSTLTENSLDSSLETTHTESGYIQNLKQADGESAGAVRPTATEGERRRAQVLVGGGDSDKKKRGRHRKADARADRGAGGRRGDYGGVAKKSPHPQFGMGGGEFLGNSAVRVESYYL